MAKSITIRGRVVIDSRGLKADLAKIKNMVKKTVDDLNKSSTVKPTIHAKLKVDQSSLKGVASSAGKSFENHLKKSFSGAAKSLQSDLKKVAVASAAAMAGLGLGVKKGLSVSGEVATSMQEIKALGSQSEVTLGNMEELMKSVNKAARDLPVSFSEAAAAASNMKRAGKSIDFITKNLENVAAFATATGTAMDKSASIAATAGNVFSRYIGDDAGAAMDYLQAAANGANQTVEDLFETMGSLKGVAVDPKAFAQLSMIAADAGVKGSKQGTFIENFLTNAQLNADKLKDEFNIDVFNDDGSLVDQVELIDQMRSKFQQLNAEEQLRLQGLFGKRGKLLATEIARTDNDDRFAEIKASAENAIGSVERARSVMERGFSGSVAKMKSNIEGFFLAVGDGAQPAAWALAQVFTQSLQSFLGDDGQFKDMFANLSTKFAEMFGSFSTEMIDGKEIKVFDLDEGVKEKIAEIGDFLRNTIQNIINLIQQGAIAFQQIQPFIESMVPFISQIAAGVSAAVGNLLQLVAANLPGVLMAAVGAAVALAAPFLAAALPVLAIKAAIIAAVVAAGVLIQKMMKSGQASQLFQAGIQRAKQLIEQAKIAAGNLKAEFDKVIVRVSNFWQSTSKLRGEIAKIAGTILNGIGTGLSKIPAIVTAIVTKVRQFWDHTRGIREALKQIVTFYLLNAIKSAQQIGAYMRTVLGHFIKTVRESKTFEILLKRAKGVATFISKVVSSIFAWLTKSTAKTNEINGSFGFLGKLAVFVKNAITITFKILDSIFVVADAISGVVFKILGFLVNGWVTQFKLIKGLITGIKDLFKKIMDFLTGIGSKMGEFITQNQSLSGIVSTISGAFEGMKTTLGDLITKTMEWINNLDIVKKGLNFINNLRGGGGGSDSGTGGGGKINIDSLFSGGSDSLIAKIIGQSEGTRSAGGGFTDAFGGHNDPGDGAANKGSFSASAQRNAALAGLTPEETDQWWIENQLKPETQNIMNRMKAAGLENSKYYNEVLISALDLLVQSPEALKAEDGFLDRLGTLKDDLDNAANRDAAKRAITMARTESYADPNTGSYAKTFAKTQQGMYDDQKRRMDRLFEGMAEHSAVFAANSSGGGGRSSAAGGTTSRGNVYGVDTGNVTGEAGTIGSGSAHHIDLKFNRQYLSIEDRIKALDAVAKQYAQMGRQVEFSNDRVAGEVWDFNASMEDKLDLYERAVAAHSHSITEGWDSIDYYAPKMGQSIYTDPGLASAKAAPIVAPGFEGGIIERTTGHRYGAMSAIDDAQGNYIAKIGHGDETKAQSGVIQINSAEINAANADIPVGPVAPGGFSTPGTNSYMGPTDSRGGSKTVVIPLDHARTRIADDDARTSFKQAGATGASYGGYTERDFQDAIVPKITAQLEANGFEVVVMNPDDFQSYESYDRELAKLAEQGSIVTPIHYDAVGAKMKDGSIYNGGYLTRTQAGDSQDAALGKAISDELRGSLEGSTASRFKADDTMENATIKAAKAAPAALIELGAMGDFIDKYGGLEGYLASAEANAAVDAVTRGITKFAGGPVAPGSSGSNTPSASTEQAPEPPSAEDQFAAFSGSVDSIAADELEAVLAPTIKRLGELDLDIREAEANEDKVLVAELNAEKVSLESTKTNEEKKSSINADINKLKRKESLGIADAFDLEKLERKEQELKDLGGEFKRIVAINAKEAAKAAKDALQEQQREIYDAWETENQQLINAQKQNTTNEEDKAINALDGEIIEAKEGTEKRLLELKKQRLEVERDHKLLMIDEQFELDKLLKLKELGVEQAEGYNIDEAIAQQQRKIANSEELKQISSKNALRQGELDLLKTVVDETERLIKDTKVGSSIQLPKTQVQEWNDKIRETNTELTSTRELFMAQRLELQNLIAGTQQLTEEEKAYNNELLDSLELAYQFQELAAAKKIQYAQDMRDNQRDQALNAIQSETRNQQASALDSFGFTNEAEKLRAINEQKALTLQHEQKMLELQHQRDQLETNTEINPEDKMMELDNLDSTIKAEGELYEARKKNLELQTSDRAKQAQAIMKTAMNDLSSGIHDVLMGAKTMGEVFRDMLKNIASQLIKMAAQKLMQNAFAGMLGGANGANGASGLLGSLGKMFGFNDGGFVPYQAGTTRANVDTVPALLTQGEGVLNRREVSALGGRDGFEKFRKSLRRYNSGGYVSNRLSGPVSTSNMRTRQQVNYKFETQRVGNMDVVSADQINALEQRLNGRIADSSDQVREGLADGFRSSTSFRDGLGIPDA